MDTQRMPKSLTLFLEHNSHALEFVDRRLDLDLASQCEKYSELSRAWGLGWFAVA